MPDFEKTIMLLVGAIVILFLVFKFFQSATPRGFAKQLARIQIHALKRQKMLHPEYPKERQYFEAINTRPGYSEETCREIIAMAREQYAEGGELNFQMVVQTLTMMYEYPKRVKRYPTGQEVVAMHDGILAAGPFE